MKAKYVVIDLGAGLEVPLLCPMESGVTHAQLAAGAKVVGAGFCRIDGKDVLAHGESIGLRVESRRTTDAEVIHKHFFTQ